MQRKSFDVVDILAVRPEVGTDGAVLQTCAALLRTADPASVLVVNAIGFEGPSGAVQCLLSEDGYLIFRRDSCDPLSPGIVDAIARAAEPSGLGWRLMGPGGVADALGWVATVLTVGGSSVDLASPPGDGST